MLLLSNKVGRNLLFASGPRIFIQPLKSPLLVLILRIYKAPSALAKAYQQQSDTRLHSNGAVASQYPRSYSYRIDLSTSV